MSDALTNLTKVIGTRVASYDSSLGEDNMRELTGDLIDDVLQWLDQNGLIDTKIIPERETKELKQARALLDS